MKGREQDKQVRTAKNTRKWKKKRDFQRNVDC